MKKPLILIGILCISSICTVAQTRTRVVYDTFDTANGVQVYTPVATPKVQNTASKSQKSPKTEKAPLVRKTSMMQESYALRDYKMQNSSPVNVGNAVYSSNLGGFSTGIDSIDSYIVGACKMHNVDPKLIYAQMHQESSFKIRATSNKGASGLMQLMPATAMRFGVTNIYDPEQNIYAGVKYMRWLLDKFDGDVSLALAGYNAGEGAVIKYGNQIPPYNETQEYVRRIMARYTMIGNPMSMKTAKRVTRQEEAKIETKSSAPLATYEKSVYAVRMPDGRMRLVSQ